MTLVVNHTFSSQIPTTDDSLLVSSKHWNSTHTITGTLDPSQMTPIAANTILANPTGALAAPIATLIGATLLFASSTLQTAAGTGDVAWPQNSFVTTIQPNVVSDAKLRQSAGKSVIGRASNTTGNVADITAPAGADWALRVDSVGNTIGWGGINLGSTNAVGGVLNVGNGGTGRSTLTQFAVLVGAGTGAITQIAVGPSKSVLQGTGSDPIFTVTPTVNTLTVNNNTATIPSPPATAILQVANSDGSATAALIDAYGSTSSIILRRANNAAVSPAALANNDLIGSILAFGRGATGYSAANRANLSFNAAELWTDTAQGTYITLSTTAAGGTTLGEALRLNANKSVQLSGSQYQLAGVVQTNSTGVLSTAAMSGDATITAGGVITIANSAVTYAKIQNVAASRLLGNPTGAPAAPSEITLGATLAFSGAALQTTAHTGDVTTAANSFATTIAADAVTNAKLANMATATFKGRITAGTGDPEDLTGTQATTLLDVFTSALKGLAPASGGGTTNFLRADATWAAPPSSPIPVGTVMVFFQAGAPTGWTQVVTQNDKALRVVSGTGGGTGGTSAFSTVFGKTATDTFTLTTTQLPSHTHTQTWTNSAPLSNSGANSNMTFTGPSSVGGSDFTLSNTGSGTAFAHGMDIRVQFIDIILASKN